VKAIAKTRAEAGIELIDVDIPTPGPGELLVKIERGSVCGTDLHIYNWDSWSSHRIHPPRIIGHEFCGTVKEVGAGVTSHKVGDFFASESHIVCGHCLQCLAGQGHVCINTTILGVDIDGGFRGYSVIPAQNARLIPSSIPREVASMLDAVGNAVHTVMAGPVEGRTILITGLGPIGLFAVAICKALGAAKIIGTEISDYRINLAEQLGIDTILNPMKQDVSSELRKIAPLGVDATLEMSGHPSSLHLAIEHTRPGGRVSLLGVFPHSEQTLDFNSIIFKGLDVQGIVGRKIWKTWEDMLDLFVNKGLDLSPVVTHHVAAAEAIDAFEVLKKGNAGKIVLDFEDWH